MKNHPSCLALGAAWLALGAYFAGSSASAAQPPLARPSAAQYAWHEQERIMFVHFGVATWENSETDRDGTTNLSRMDPAAFSGDAICAAAKAWGARQVLLVAKHVGGFCWWPTQTTDYCTRSIPWREGKGDLVREVAEACRRHGLAMGVYLYPDDPRFAKAIGRSGKTDEPARQEEYNRLFRQQWEEVLAICGPDLVREVWLDGGCEIELGDILARRAPNAVVFQGRNASIRWVGNEKGITRDPNWNSLGQTALTTGVATQLHGTPYGDAWAPVECDTTLYEHKWFWAPQHEVKRKSLLHLLSLYIQSVGRGSVLVLNSTPTTEGRIPEGDQARYRELGEAIERNFGRPLAAVTDKTARDVELDLGGVQRINCSDLWEDYRQGHRIRAYVVEGRVNGAWVKLAQGTAVGRRKLDLFGTVAADRVRVRVTENVGAPLIRGLQVHTVDEALLQPANRVEASDHWWPAGEWKMGGDVRVDLSMAVTQAGQYEVRFQVGKGGKPAVLKRAEVRFDGQEAAAVFSTGVGTPTLNINRTQVVGEDASTALRVELDAPAGSSGTVQIRRK